LLPPTERGRANGVMSAAKYTGVLVGGPGLALVATAAGWRAACLCAVVLLLLPALLVLFAVEGERPPARPALLRETMRAFASRAPRPGGGRLLGGVRRPPRGAVRRPPGPVRGPPPPRGGGHPLPDLRGPDEPPPQRSVIRGRPPGRSPAGPGHAGPGRGGGAR